MRRAAFEKKNRTNGLLTNRWSELLLDSEYTFNRYPSIDKDRSLYDMTLDSYTTILCRASRRTDCVTAPMHMHLRYQWSDEVE